MKKEEEKKERELVLESRKITRLPLQEIEVFRQLVDLYQRQPVFRTRTSTSIANQAYSTPLPIAYLLAYLAGVTQETTIYEPAAGHGALLISSNPELVAANEIDPDRALFLKDLGYKVTTHNAIIYNPNQEFDVVLANPPFGSVVKDGVKQTYRIGGSYTTEQIDHAIAYHSARFMKPNGAAGFIIAGKIGSDDRRSQSYGQKSSRNFFYYLYNTYNVVLHISLAGKLYAKQGARYPFDLIIIKGRGKSRLDLPAVKLPKVYESFTQLEELFKESLMDIEIEVLFQKAKSKKLPGIRYEDDQGDITLRVESGILQLQSGGKQYTITYISYKEWEDDVVFYLKGFDAEGNKEFFRILDSKYTLQYCRHE